MLSPKKPNLEELGHALHINNCWNWNEDLAFKGNTTQGWSRLMGREIF